MVFSSSSAWGQSYSISGNIKDESNNSVPYTNIVLYKIKDSVLITGTTSDDSGDYKLINIEPDNYILQFSFIGFQEETREISLSNDLVLPTIILKESIENLSEVDIVVKRPTLKQEVDRLVFSVANTALSEGNMMEVIRNTPGVLVLDNTITVKNSSPTVYINDKKVHLNSDELAELLEGTSASSIQSVEVITNPSAKYDADSGVVLNIKMSRNIVTGYSGSIFGNYTQGVFPRSDFGTTNFFKSSKVNLYVNYNFSDDKIDRVNHERVDYLNPNGSLNERWLSDIDRNTWSTTHTINANIDIELSKNDALSISTNMLFLPYFKYVVKNQTSVFNDQNSKQSRFASNNNSMDDKSNLGFDLNYKHTFDKDQSEIKLSGHFTSYDYKRDQNVESDYFDNSNTFIESTSFKTRADQNTQIATTQLDYSLPLDETSTFESGIKASSINTESGIVHYDIVNGQDIINAGNTNAFDYNEGIYAAYASFEKKWEKLSLNIGIRIEQTNIEGLSISTNLSNTQNYLEWFPTASMSYKLSEFINAYSNYKRSIQRPNYNLLNPFKFFLNDNTIVTGNPALQPIFIDHLVLGTSFKNKFFLEGYYKIYKSNIFEIPVQDNDINTITYTPLNLDETTEVGIDFLSYFNITDRWSTSFITSFYYTKDQGRFDSNSVEQDKWANYSLFTNNISTLKDNSLSVSLSLIYTSSNLQGLQVVDKGQLYSDLSIKKTVLKGNGIISVAASDLFNTQDFYVSTKFLDQNSFIFTDLDTRYVKIGFRYKFGNTKLTINEKELDYEELERLKDKRN